MPNQPVKINAYIKVNSITPNDGVDLSPRPRAIYLAIGGDVVIQDEDGDTVTFSDMIGGQVIPISPVRILSTGTNATGILGLN